MRIANLGGRLSVLTDAGSVDVESASGGRFGADPQAVYGRWAEFLSWARTADLPAAAHYSPARLRSPAPGAGRQGVGIGLNYREPRRRSDSRGLRRPSVFHQVPELQSPGRTATSPCPPTATPTGRWNSSP